MYVYPMPSDVLMALFLAFEIYNERKSEQAHIPHAPTKLENAVYNEWQFQALATGNGTKKGIGDINCFSKGSNQHFL